MTAHPKAARARRSGRDWMCGGHLITKEFLDSIPLGPFKILSLSPDAKKRRENRVASAIATSRALKRSVRDAARAVLRAAGL